MKKEKEKEKKIPLFEPTGSMMKPYQEGIVSDPFGSYTGVPLDREDCPVQDADDL